MTNLERFKAMSADQFSDFLVKFSSESEYCGMCDYCAYDPNRDCILDCSYGVSVWLNQEGKNEK